VFELGSGHVGIVESVGAESITTIDGNWSDRVTRHTTPRNTFRGFVRNPAHGPAEAQRAAALAAARKPLYVVTTNADGERRIVFRAHSRRRLVRWMMHHTLRKGIRITRKR
jgi:predicted acylesterase/phospholipase RssA